MFGDDDNWERKRQWQEDAARDQREKEQRDYRERVKRDERESRDWERHVERMNPKSQPDGPGREPHSFRPRYSTAEQPSSAGDNYWLFGVRVSNFWAIVASSAGFVVFAWLVWSVWSAIPRNGKGSVSTPNGHAVQTRSGIKSAHKSNPSHSPAPSISEMPPVIATRIQTIVITGHGFGTHPELKPLADGFVDTAACNTNAPSLAVRQIGAGAEGWSAGEASCTNPNLIGVRLVSWTDSRIELAGFGSLLGSGLENTRWKIVPGNHIEIKVVGPNKSGSAIFRTVVKPDDTGWKRFGQQ
jgi:hypothetical protein